MLVGALAVRIRSGTGVVASTLQSSAMPARMEVILRSWAPAVWTPLSVLEARMPVVPITLARVREGTQRQVLRERPVPPVSVVQPARQAPRGRPPQEVPVAKGAQLLGRAVRRLFLRPTLAPTGSRRLGRYWMLVSKRSRIRVVPRRVARTYSSTSWERSIASSTVSQRLSAMSC
jgi:hypothetical protein